MLKNKYNSNNLYNPKTNQLQFLSMKNTSIYRTINKIIFISLSFFGGCLFFGNLNAQTEPTDSESNPKSKIIRLGNFEFEQIQESYKVNRSDNYDSTKFAQDSFFAMFDTIPCTLTFEQIICKQFFHDNQNDTHVVNQFNQLTAPNFHNGQFAKDFSYDYQGLCEWMDSVARESMANIEFYLSPGPVIGNYIWIHNMYAEYWGGAAHPNSYHSFYIFNNNTGEQAYYHHFFKPASDNEIVKLISKEFKKQYKESPWTVAESDLLTNNLTFDNFGVTFSYCPYEIGPYAMGYVDIQVPYKKIIKHLTAEGIETMKAGKEIPQMGN